MFVASRTTINCDHSHAAMLGNRRQDICYLHRKFAGRHEHDASWFVRFGFLCIASCAIDHRHAKSQGLARARASATANVNARERNWYRLSLNSKWGTKPGAGQPGVDSTVDTECGELRRRRHWFASVCVRADVAARVLARIA